MATSCYGAIPKAANNVNYNSADVKQRGGFGGSGGGSSSGGSSGGGGGGSGFIEESSFGGGGYEEAELGGKTGSSSGAPTPAPRRDVAPQRHNVSVFMAPPK